jgi:hypothetical protein
MFGQMKSVRSSVQVLELTDVPFFSARTGMLRHGIVQFFSGSTKMFGQTNSVRSSVQALDW